MGRESIKLNDQVQLKLYDAKGRLKSTSGSKKQNRKADPALLMLLYLLKKKDGEKNGE